ncbi:MAG TPA: response regulator, partial [Gammaproteobacteria bacterium]|nr:response regulator [Gammaproteobacteria bacterium]
DRGIGIPAELLERIFDLFTQADQSMARSHSGLGIGLTIARRLVEMHGGTIVARSAGVDRGSEFIVRMPITPDQGLGTEPAANAAPAAARRRVLVIDDNPSVLKSMCLLLESLGHDVRGASDGRAGVALAADLRPDVVLLDLAMPYFSGFETARLLREQPWARDLVLVALTGWGQQEHRQATKDAGFDHHFVKPIDGRQLQTLLASLQRG